jgi:MFS family permease
MHAPWEARVPFFYGWVVVAISVLISFFGAGMFWGGSVFVNPMQDDLGWSRSEIYLAFTVRGWMGIVLAPLIGPYADRLHGARTVAIITGVIASIATALISGVSESWQFILLFGVMGGIGIVGQSFPTFALVPKWFISKRGSALGWASMGSPIAAMGLAPALAVLIDAYGWRSTWIIVGIASFILTVLPSMLLRRQPEDVGLLPDGATAPHPDAPVSARPIPEQSVTPREAVKQRLFWMLVLGSALGSLSNNGLPGNLVPLYADLGFSRDLAVLGFSIYGLFSMIGRFFWAYAVGRVNIRRAMIAMAVVGTLVTPSVYFLPGLSVLAFSALNGFVIGGYVALSPMVWPEYFGRRHVGAIGGFARPFITIIQASGPLMMALSYDRAGGYGPALWLTAASWAASGVIMLIARPSQRAANIV